MLITKQKERINTQFKMLFATFQFTTLVTIFTTFANSQSVTENENVKFSKLLNEKSEFLRFTSIASTQTSPRFQNVYNRAEDVPSIASRNQQHFDDHEPEEVDFPEASLITEPSPQDQFVRIRQGQLTAAERVDSHDGIVTTINQQPISGRTQVTALRQSSGKRLNISPIFLSHESNKEQKKNETARQVQFEGVTENVDDDDEVTTIQNIELNRETTTPQELETTTTTTKPFLPIVNVTTPNPRVGVTIFDNRTQADRIYSTTPISLDVDVDTEDDDNFLPDSFHRNGHFPGFEDVPTNLAAAESSQPARVNVRPASSGKDYEYEYIYYYYDDDDDTNSTTTKPLAVTTTKADLASLKGVSDVFQSEKLNPQFPQEQSNVLDNRNQKSQPIPSDTQFQPEVLSVPNPTLTSGLTPVISENQPIVIKQSNIVPQNTFPQIGPFNRQGNNHRQGYPVVPRSSSTPPPVVSTTQRLRTTSSTQPSSSKDFQNKLRNQPPPANQFEPPVLQFAFVDGAHFTPTHPTAVSPIRAQTPEPRQRGRSPFQRNHTPDDRLPRNHLLQNEVAQDQISLNQLPQNQLPQNQLPQNQLPQNHFTHTQLPQNHFLQNQLPQHELPQPQLPQSQFLQNQLPQNELPQNHFPQSHFPQNHFSQNQLPQNHFLQNQLPQNDLPQNELQQNQLPQNHFPLNELPQNQLPQNELPQIQNHHPQEQIPPNQLPQNLLPQNQTPQQQFTQVVVDQSSRRPDSTLQDSPVPRRSPSRRQQNKIIDHPEPEFQQDQPPTTTPRHTVPAVLIEATRASARVRFPTRPTFPVADQFQPPFLPSPEEAIVEIESPALETITTQPPFDDERQARENFARQKSISDLYALSRLHQLAINTKIPDKKNPESTQLHSQRGTPPRNAGGFLSSAEITTNDPFDQTQTSDSTTISSFVPSPYVTTGDFKRIPLSTTTTTTTEEAALVSPTNEVIVNASPNERPLLKDTTHSRFRGRNRERPITSTAATTEAVPKTYNHNRFSGRRRTVAQPDASTTETHSDNAFVPPVPSSTQPPQLQQPRGPTRNRFGGRTRPTTSTTEAYQVSEQPETKNSLGRIPNRRPYNGGQLNTRRRLSTSTASSVDNSFGETSVNVPSVGSLAVDVDPVSDSEKRGPIRGRNRPGAGVGPIVGRPLRGGRTTTTTTTTTTTEQPEPLFTADETHTSGETLPTTIIEADEPVPTQQIQEANAGVITQKISVSSSTTTLESAEPAKRGSAGVLGRLRTRSKTIGPIHLPTTSTTIAPEVTTLERKASRLNGILNRRKSTTSTTTHTPVVEPIEDESEVQGSAEGIPPNGVIVQVSSVVSETEEFPEHHNEEEYSSTTTQGSILHRLKSQRKPGSLFRKRVE